MKYYFFLNNNCIIQVTNYTWLSYVFLYFTKGSGGGAGGLGVTILQTEKKLKHARGSRKIFQEGGSQGISVCRGVRDLFSVRYFNFPARPPQDLHGLYTS